MSPWLWLALGGASLFVWYESQQVAWPPSPSVQTGLVTQIGVLWQQQTGQPMSPAQTAAVQQALVNAPQMYSQSLPAGTPLTTQGYQQWVLAKATAAIASGNPSTNWQGMGSGQPYSGTGPYQPQAGVAGPLGLQGASPYFRFDEWGNAFGTNGQGQEFVVYSENYGPADYRTPLHFRQGIADFTVRRTR